MPDPEEHMSAVLRVGKVMVATALLVAFSQASASAAVLVGSVPFGSSQPVFQLAVNPNTIVVLQTGGPVEMPWIRKSWWRCGCLPRSRGSPAPSAAARPPTDLAHSPSA